MHMYGKRYSSKRCLDFLFIISLSKVFTTILALLNKRMLLSSSGLSNADFSQPFCLWGYELVISVDSNGASAFSPPTSSICLRQSSSSQART